ncbi:hypothetical protein QFC19_007727 [Naganishia cerealis]|uniref:Uncharacterized protein n=1 Tax=Naganishia cerealis TaxID=610337 RepID=A0ACC2V6X7_9TREE|nr:hypothetical protein QFC19_007727 [Naganishia cerealis]
MFAVTLNKLGMDNTIFQNNPPFPERSEGSQEPDTNSLSRLPDWLDFVFRLHKFVGHIEEIIKLTNRFLSEKKENMQGKPPEEKSAIESRIQNVEPELKLLHDLRVALDEGLNLLVRPRVPSEEVVQALKLLFKSALLSFKDSPLEKWLQDDVDDADDADDAVRRAAKDLDELHSACKRLWQEHIEGGFQVWFTLKEESIDLSFEEPSSFLLGVATAIMYDSSMLLTADDWSLPSNTYTGKPKETLRFKLSNRSSSTLPSTPSSAHWSTPSLTPPSSKRLRLRVKPGHRTTASISAPSEGLSDSI